jgi:hypothetical protein
LWPYVLPSPAKRMKSSTCMARAAAHRLGTCRTIAVQPFKHCYSRGTAARFSHTTPGIKLGGRSCAHERSRGSRR